MAKGILRTRQLGIALLTICLSAWNLSEARAAYPELLLFGGTSHKDFLGCLNCPPADNGSVWNAIGEHGSRLSPNSIWNRLGTYGNKFSSLSPWNKFSSTAPVVVDRDGTFYGYFSANKLHPKRTNVAFLLLILEDHDWLIENLDEVRSSLSSSLGPASERNEDELEEIIRDNGPHARTLFLSMWAERNHALTGAYNSGPEGHSPVESAPSAQGEKPPGEVRVEGGESVDPKEAQKILQQSPYSGNFSRMLPRSSPPKQPTAQAQAARANPVVVLKNGSIMPGVLQKYENGLAYILVPNPSGSKSTLTTVHRSQVDEEATAKTQANR